MQNYLFVISCVSWLLFASSSSAFSLHMREIYGVPKSGWASPDFKWGYASGTGHDCAMICRNQYGTRQSRESLVNDLVELKGPPFEEVKLVLALAWQKGRWDGCDGGPGGYGEVLSEMAKAQRYEVGTEEECSKLLFKDMQERFHLLDPSDEDKQAMMSLSEELEDADMARRRCSGLVLKSMGFIDNGL